MERRADTGRGGGKRTPR
uniref:Uncharacterized protein n=1 Tax=Pyricularia oryzae (strain 70-15 / ATCC MYA-4617 / FGSC 8958) TaxID=242507 RepID=Q2KEY6_PYRO7|nr:hypothetical protein MGCH7_ch7g900 [Pyricularia oryzae 70-15]